VLAADGDARSLIRANYDCWAPAIIALSVALSGCVAPAVVQPVRTPYWLQRDDSSLAVLRIVQSASFSGSQIRICRRILNVSSRPAIIRNVAPEGNNFGELSVAFYGRDGEWIAPSRPAGPGVYHPPFVPSPPPAGGADTSIYTVLSPGGHAGNCRSYDIDHDRRVFQAVTYYSPSVVEHLVPSEFRQGRLILESGSGPFASPPCVVDRDRRIIECATSAAAGSGRSR